MKKKNLFLLILVTMLILIVSMYSGIKNQKNDLDYVIKTALRIQYGWKSEHNLTEICTNEFMQTMQWDETYIGRRIYSIDNNYRDNIIEVNSDEIIVDVYVYSPDIRIHRFTLKKIEGGQYFIHKIEHDI